MSWWPYGITLDGVGIPLDEVRADVQIHHGRADVFAEPAATTCQIVLLEVPDGFARSFRVGAGLIVGITDGTSYVPRFTGRVTDAALDVDTLTVIATGTLSQLGQYTVGLVDWPQDFWSNRITRVFTEAGLSSLLLFDTQGTAMSFDPLLAARDAFAAGPLTLADAVNALAAMVGAAVTDHPDGRILVQPLGDRKFLPVPGHSGVIDPADVAYAPVWAQALPSANVVTVGYTPGETLPPRTGFLTDDSPVVTGLPSTLDILPGMEVSGIGIPQNTSVQAVNSPSQITLTRAANITANKDGQVSPGETRIDGISDTSDLSIGMTVEKAGDLQSGTTVIGIGSGDVTISLQAIGTHVGNFLFTAPAAAALTFGVETAYVTVRDEASIALYGERPVTIDTTFLDVDDANRRATDRLERTAIPRWSLPAAPVLRGLELKIGYPVTITEMPAAAPYTDWMAALEGWSETITGDEWTMELTLSDPALSGYVFRWTSIPAEWAWNELDPAAAWFDAISLEGITP